MPKIVRLLTEQLPKLSLIGKVNNKCMTSNSGAAGNSALDGFSEKRKYSSNVSQNDGTRNYPSVQMNHCKFSLITYILAQCIIFFLTRKNTNSFPEMIYIPIIFNFESLNRGTKYVVN